jgi:AcrR family transcriptional regulator
MAFSNNISAHVLEASTELSLCCADPPTQSFHDTALGTTSVTPVDGRIGSALPRGPHKLTRQQVEDDQKRRLVEAMIDEVSEVGYAASTVAEIIERAQVSRKTFYVHFASREELLLAAFDTASTWMLEQTRKASRRTGGSTRRLEAALRKLARCAIESPGATTLCTIDVAAAGNTGFARRQAFITSTGDLFEECLSTAHQQAVLPPLLSAAIAAATYRVLDAQLRVNQADTLTTTALELARWVRSYHPAPPDIAEEPFRDDHQKTWPTHDGHHGGRAPGTLTLDSTNYNPPTGKASRGYLAHTHRERILDSVARLTAEQGYTELTAQSIATAADISERAFLAQFANKDEAFTAACEIGHTKAQAIVARAREHAPTWRTGVQNAINGLLDFFASEALYTKLALIAAPLASPQMAIRHNEQAVAYARLLFHDAPQRRRPPTIAPQAVVYAIFEIAYAYAANNRITQLPGTHALTTYLTFAPYLGTTEATKYALA